MFYIKVIHACKYGKGGGGGNKLLFTDVHLYVMLKAVHTLITGPHILTGVRT